MANDAMVSGAGWRWFGYAGHFCGGGKCRFHLSTLVGTVLVSTVGDYTPDGETPTPLGIDGRLFETHVFRCDGIDANGDPKVLDWTAIDGVGYRRSRLAEEGHYEVCRRWEARQRN